MKVDIQLKGFKELARSFDPKVLRNATVRTLNDTAALAHTATSKHIRSSYTISAKAIKKALRVKKANFTAFVAEIVATGKRIPVAAFNTRKNKKGISVQIKRRGARKTIKHAFKATMSSGHVGIWQRFRSANDYDGRLPLKAELRSLSIGQAMESISVLTKTKRVIEKNLPKIFKKQIDFYQWRARKGRG